jgi:hypothetical protein
MARQDYGSIWPLRLLIACLFAVGITSSHALEGIRAGQDAADASGEWVDHRDQIAAESPSQPVPATAEDPRPSPGPALLSATGSSTGSERTPSFLAGCRPPEPVGKLVDRPKGSDTQRPRVEAQAAPARATAPHEEVCRLPANEAVAQDQPPPLLARPTFGRYPPSPTHPDTHPTTSPSSTLPYPDTGLSPLDVTTAGRADRKVSPAGSYDWPEPEALLERLDQLAAQRATAEWATETARLVRKLGSAVSQGSDEPLAIIRQLQELASRATVLAATLDDKALASELPRAGHALSRRLDIWEQLVEIGDWGPLAAEEPQPDPKQLSLCLAQIDELTGNSAEGRAWREYLLADALSRWSGKDRPPKDRLPRRLAQRVLKRLNQVPMSTEQQEFVSSGPVAGLQAELRRWAAEPVALAELLRHLEQYEKTGLASDARLLAADCRHLELTSGDDRRRLTQRLEANYRNANLRVVVTEELLDRLMPEREPQYAPVHDTVLGRPVSGRSMTSSKVGVRLLPDPNRARLALEITGQVASLTSSTSGPATFYNKSTSTYVARKPLEIDLKGIRLSPTDVEVQGNTRLRSLQTDFDGVPLVGGLVSWIARSQHEQKHAEISQEVQQKVALRARRQIDSEVEARLGQVSERLHQRLLRPLEVSRLDPTIIDAETTDQRLTIRLRLAGEDQLGGHTPRPRAPSDSLASFQVHETAINNMLQRLALDGRTFTLPELARHVAAQLDCSSLWDIDPAHEDVTITFADRDAMAVSLRDGRVTLRLAIARLTKSPQHWRDFTVLVDYRPQVAGRSARLVRDGIVQLGGRRIPTGEQIALRGIFAKTFSRRRTWNLTPQRLVSEDKFADLAVTQFVIDDGWLGIALGPERVTERSALRQ